MKGLLRILTGLMLLVAIPIAIFAFFPKLAEWAGSQSWAQTLYSFLIGSGILALFTGLDLLNRVDVYKKYAAMPEGQRESFWKDNFAQARLGFLRTGVVATLIMAIILVFMVFYLMILPKAPEGDWYLWTIKILGIGIAIGVLMLLNAVSFLNNGKKVILGIDEKPASAEKVLTWQDKLFQIKPTFMDAEVDLKEDFDGISELDNPAPPWFMYLFYSTIVFAGVYLVRYTWMHYAPSQTEEYVAESKQLAAIKIKAAGNVDENNVTVETDAAKIADAAELFKNKCAMCHGEKGEGKTGPNLTDDSWIHGNSVKDVFKTIKYGVLEKGMLAWKETIPPPKMKALATYVLSMQKAPVLPPNGLAPQGEKMAPKEKL